jgi:hypothetical protein
MHWPAVQVPLSQTFAQVPQLVGSVNLLVQIPPQTSGLAAVGHAHVPAAHALVGAEHTVVHEPQ